MHTTGALEALTAAATASQDPFGACEVAREAPAPEAAAATAPHAAQTAAPTTVWSHCAINCPGRCPLKITVVDDQIARVEPYSTATLDLNGVQPRACLRGLTYRRWANSPDRLDYPMKRVKGSRRGQGLYERIGWDEAIDLVATNLRRVIDTYGNQAVYCAYGTGVNCTTVHDNNIWWRLLNLLGGCLTYYSNYSAAQVSWVAPYMFGSMTGSTLSAARDSDLVFVFGSSPVETRQGGAVAHHDWVRLREESPAELIVVDPRLSDTLSGHSASWQPINPGTDAALCAAMAHELIVNDRVDLDFLHTYCVGYDEETLPLDARGQNASYRAYIMGEGYDLVE